MRLIDADKLRVNCFCIDKICVDARTIEIAPTVKAIPIEWIKEKQNKYCLNYEFTKTISQLLEMWEKDNEQAN